MSSFMGSSSLGGFGGLKPTTGSSFTPTSTGTLKRGGVQGEYIPKGYRAGQLQNFTPQQMELFSQLFGHLGPESFLSKLAGGDESFFEQMEAPAHRQFQGQLGQLASRFSGMGTGGRRGSGFQNTATAAASNFSQDLAANRQNLQRQALMDLMGLSNQLLGQRPQERFLFQKPQKDNSGAWGLGGAAVGGLLGSLGGPGGALAGASIGSQLGSSLGGGKGSQGVNFSGFEGLNLPKTWGGLFGSSGPSQEALSYDAMLKANPSMFFGV